MYQCVTGAWGVVATRRDGMPGTASDGIIEMIESLMHRDEGVIGWTWRVAVARDYWRRTVDYQTILWSTCMLRRV